MIRDINIVRWKGANYQSPIRRMICMLAHRSILLIIVRIYMSNIIIYAYNNVYWCVFYIYKHRTIGRNGNNLLKQLVKKFCYTRKILCITRALSEFILHLKRPQLLAKFHIIKLNLASIKPQLVVIFHKSYRLQSAIIIVEMAPLENAVPLPRVVQSLVIQIPNYRLNLLLL